MPKFRKKPVEIEAEQFMGIPVKGMCQSSTCFIFGTHHVHTIHRGQPVKIEVGDWVIPEPDGAHFYPCKPDIFEATYEPVEN